MRFSERALAINPSSTLAFEARAKDMIRAGKDIIGFGAGEPDFDTPQFIQDAGVEGIRKGITRYTPVAGILGLREAICQKMKRDHGLDYTPAEVLVSAGAKQCLYNAFQVLCSPGDEVIIPAPYWVSYVEQVRLAGGIPVIVNTSETDGFRLSPEKLQKSITPRTRVLLLNSPSNPTGTVYTREDLQALAQIAVQYDLTVISDEVYEKLVYDGARHFSIAEMNPEIKARTIVINGVSKTYAMTGWRIGYAVGNADAIRLMANLQGHSTSNASSIAQHASIAALNGPVGELELMRAEFERRRNVMIDRLNQIPGITCRTPEGAFYAFANIGGLIGSRLGDRLIENGDDLADILLDQALVAVIPGSGFGMPDFVRLSYATSMARIEDGLARIARYIRQNLVSGERAG